MKCSRDVAEVHDRREKRRLRETFDTKAEAVAWRSDAQTALRRGEMLRRTRI